MATTEEQKYRNVLQEESFLNEYQIKSVLGKPGGFGITYLALDTNLHQLIAIKEYLPSDLAVRERDNTICVMSSADNEAFEWGRKCFIDESRVLARFHHPNIVRVLRFFEANSTAYMVMEYQEGENLNDYLKAKGTLSEEELLNIVLPLLDGLEEIHTAGLLHRDIKPNNIYIRHDNTPVLLDFGSARYAIGQKSRSVTSIVTPSYAPLEQYDSEVTEQGPWTDIYALGAVMYLAIKGEPPPPATRRVIKDPIIPATVVGQGRYSKNILKAIDWALKPNENDRPKNIEELRKTLLENSNNSIISNEKEAIVTPHWLVMVAGVVFLVLIVAVLGVIQYQNNEIANEKILREKAEKYAILAKEQVKQANEAQKIAEDEHQQAEAVIKQLQEFMVEARKDSLKEGSCNLAQKYYNITNVSIEDRLNIREHPTHKSKAVGKIPPDAICIPYLNELEIVKSKSGTRRAWVMIDYKGTQGWVNTYYIMENKECPVNIQETQ